MFRGKVFAEICSSWNFLQFHVLTRQFRLVISPEQSSKTMLICFLFVLLLTLLTSLFTLPISCSSNIHIHMHIARFLHKSSSIMYFNLHHTFRLLYHNLIRRANHRTEANKRYTMIGSKSSCGSVTWSSKLKYSIVCLVWESPFLIHRQGERIA